VNQGLVEMRNLGSSGLRTPRLVLGGNVFGWTATGEEAFRILDRFIEAGGTMIDTADVYSSWVPGHRGGESETMIGQWLRRRKRRDDVLIATKVGLSEGLSSGTIERGIDASLARLGVDHVDLYYSHKDDPQTRFEETLAAFDRLVRIGKVRAIGASQISAERLETALETSAANGLAAYSVLQTWYSLVERPRFEGPLAALAQTRRLGVLAFFSLANGFLTGKYRSEADLGKSVRGERVTDYLSGKGPRILSALDQIAAESSATPAQVALAWTAAQPGVTAPLASARTLEQLDELLGAMTLELTPAHVAQLNAVSAES
jgi:aryl-alcohol dehydrogenase-like predicted oxidoreductase